MFTERQEISMSEPERPVAPTLSIQEAEAFLWAVRNLTFEAVRDGPYHGAYDRAGGHGALSGATNRLEESLGAALMSDATGPLEQAARRSRDRAGVASPQLLGIGAVLASESGRKLVARQQRAITAAAVAHNLPEARVRDVVAAYLRHMQESE